MISIQQVLVPQNKNMIPILIFFAVSFYLLICMNTLQQQILLPVVNGFSVVYHNYNKNDLSKRTNTYLTKTNNDNKMNHNKACNQIRRKQQSLSLFQSTESTNTATSATSIKSQSKFDYALLFDCDGVILETEELHRVAYNRAFDYYQLQINNEPVHWSVEYYDMLQNSIGGGKQKMMFHFRTTMNGQFPSFIIPAEEQQQQQVIIQSPPRNEEEEILLVDILQNYKTKIYQQLMENDAIPRPGIVSLMDEALQDTTIAVGVCSASTKSSALKTLQVCLGQERISQLNICILGDDVSTKKPDPLIYTTACTQLNLQPNQCIVIEDSIVGLRAAIAAQMNCIITYTSSISNIQEFYKEGAIAIVPDLQSRNVTLASIFDPLRANSLQDILKDKKDPIL